MWYIICSILAALIILISSKNLKSSIGYIAASILIPTIAISLWYSFVKSNSKDKVWALTKAFAISHSIMCLIWLISEDLFKISLLEQLYHRSEILSSGMSLEYSSQLILIMWSIGIFFSLILGLLTKEVEK